MPRNRPTTTTASTATSAPPPPVAVAAVYDSWPDLARQRTLELRSLVLHTAAGLAAVGPLTETLKWGEPAYLTEATRSGTTVRIGWKPQQPDHGALFVNCRTTLIDTFRSICADSPLRFEGNRAVLFSLADPLPAAPLALCIGAALTYHHARRATSTRR